jgi:hypothetical protein
MDRKLHPDIEGMINKPHHPTCSLDDFLPAYERDDNVWWMIECGHHQNLFDAAVERLYDVGVLDKRGENEAVMALTLMLARAWDEGHIPGLPLILPSKLAVVARFLFDHGVVQRRSYESTDH